MTVANVGVNVSTFRSEMVMERPMETVKGKRPHSQYLDTPKYKVANEDT